MADRAKYSRRRRRRDVISKANGRKDDFERVKLMARDLRNGKEFPCSPRETLGGYVLAACALDKCRAVLAGWQGEYHSNCLLDQWWLTFGEIEYNAYRSFVATGATDEEVAATISA